MVTGDSGYGGDGDGSGENGDGDDGNDDGDDESEPLKSGTHCRCP